MPPKHSGGFKRSVSALSNESISTQSTITSEFYDSAEESGEMLSRNEASSVAGTSSTSSSQHSHSAATSSATRTRKRKLWTWLHFGEIGTTRKCKCKFCPATFIISGTGTMSKHVHTKHADRIGLTNETRLYGEAMPAKIFKYDVGEAHKAFLEFIVPNSHAFTLGEETSFRKFISTLHPTYRPLGGTAIKDRLMKTYVRLKQDITEKIGKKRVAFTTDRAHGIGQDWLRGLKLSSSSKIWITIDVCASRVI